MIVTLEQAASLLNTGHVVAVPTETVYGLAASIHHPKAIAEIYTKKKRPPDNPLIIHLSSSEELKTYAQDIPPSAIELANTFWPGPLTLILKANTLLIHNTIRAGLPTAAFRVPNHPIARKLLPLTGPLVMPSANLSGSPSATTSTHVAQDFGPSLPILEGGPCTHGVESTILTEHKGKWVIVRLGALAPEAFAPVLGYVPTVHAVPKSHEKPLCPGQLYRHYAPKATLTLCNVIPKDATGVVLGFIDRHYPETCHLISLGHTTRPEEVAECLYTILRDLDSNKIASALIDFNLPETGLWLTIKERLQKASTKQGPQPGETP